VRAGSPQYAGVPLPEGPADPDMCGHLWPVLGRGAVEAVGAGLAAAGFAGVDDVCDVRAAGVEEVEALAMLSPSARLAPSTAPPAAVPMSGLVILTRFSFRWCPPGRRPAGVTRAPCGCWLGRAG